MFKIQTRPFAIPFIAFRSHEQSHERRTSCMYRKSSARFLRLQDGGCECFATMRLLHDTSHVIVQRCSIVARLQKFATHCPTRYPVDLQKSVSWDKTWPSIWLLLLRQYFLIGCCICWISKYSNNNYKKKLLVVLALLIRRRKKCRRQRRRWWVKPWIRRRVLFGQYHALMMEINRECLGDFVNYMRMQPAMFYELLQRITPRIRKSTRYRKPLEPGLKLAITLRYLASGNSCKSLQYSFRVAHNTISLFIPEVC